MAQSGYTPISLYFSATGAAVPTAGNLVAGELALNTNDGKLYFKNSAGVVTLLAGSTSGPAGGSNTQVQYNNSGVLAGITGATTNGTVLTLVTPVLGVATATSLQGIIGNVTPAAGNFTTLGASSTATLNTLVSSGATLTGGTINGMTVGATTATTGAFTTLSNVGLLTNFTGAAKTVSAGSNVRLFQTNEAVNYAALQGSFVGAATAADRVFRFQTVEQGVANDGIISFQPDGGNLGIGTTSPAVKLDVVGAISATGTLSGGTSGTAYSFSGSAPATSLTLDSSGRLGIGTSSPTQQLDVTTTSSGTAIIVAQNTTATDGGGQIRAGNPQNIIIVGGDSNGGSLTGVANSSFIYTNSTTPLLFLPNGVEKMRLTSAGIVTMSAYGAGAATFSAAGVISSVSDETWKIKDGVPVDTDAMLKKLEPGYWYYNDEKKETFGSDRQLGFYAQNVNAAIGPEAAPTPQEGKPWGYYDRSVLAIAVISLQKALATIETLTARITALETA